MGSHHGPNTFRTKNQAQFCRHSREPLESPPEIETEELIFAEPPIITYPSQQIVRPKEFRPVEIPANPEEIKGYLIARGHPEVGLADPSAISRSDMSHRNLLNEIVARKDELGLACSIYHAFEVSIEAEDLNGRGRIPSRLDRETDLVFLLSNGTLALVEASTRKNGTKRMEDQLKDAMDWWWIMKGVVSSGIICQRKPGEYFKATFLEYDAKRSKLNRTSYT